MPARRAYEGRQRQCKRRGDRPPMLRCRLGSRHVARGWRWFQGAVWRRPGVGGAHVGKGARAAESLCEPVRHRLACLSPERHSMGEMGIERGRYTNLSIRKLCKIAVCKNGSDEVA